jgi:hypothetical protein
MEPKLKSAINIQWSPLSHINEILLSNQELIPTSEDMMKEERMDTNKEKRKDIMRGMRKEPRRDLMRDIRRDTSQGSIQE